MAKCGTCDNEMMMCTCPKGLGGGADSDNSAEDKLYQNKIEEVATAILQQYSNICSVDGSQLSQFITDIEKTIGDRAASDLIDLLYDGIAVEADKNEFKSKFKSLLPNKTMLQALSDELNLEVFPNVSNQFMHEMHYQISKLDGVPEYPVSYGISFSDAITAYNNYYQSLSQAQQTQVAKLFWGNIKKIGTPIIEPISGNNKECNVFFLLDKTQLAGSEENPGAKKDLYLQGDFHGYDSTEDRSRVTELSGSGIMLKQSKMPTDAIVTYRYVQLEPSLRGKSPEEHHGSEVIPPMPESFFRPEQGNQTTATTIPVGTPNASQKFWGEATQIVDENTRHRPHYFEQPGAERIFRVNSEPKRAHLLGEAVNWSGLLSRPQGSPQRHFNFQHTLYSKVTGDIQEADNQTHRADAGPNELFSESGQYSDCTRAIHVFTPSSGKIDNLVIVNDGLAYLSMGAMDKYNQMVEEGALSPNTAFVFVMPLPGLKQTMEINDPKANLPGMGERTIEYEHGIDEYAHFLGDKLLPYLNNLGIEVPTEPENRVMIVSSLSGTAGVYIGSKFPGLIGSVIAQSPSPSSRQILQNIVDEYEPSQPRAQIHLSCGSFEQPGFADNTNLPFAHELADRLNLDLHVEEHGHQHLAWSEELTQSLPAAIPTCQVDSRLDV